MPRGACNYGRGRELRATGEFGSHTGGDIRPPISRTFSENAHQSRHFHRLECSSRTLALHATRNLHFRYVSLRKILHITKFRKTLTEKLTCDTSELRLYFKTVIGYVTTAVEYVSHIVEAGFTQRLLKCAET